MPPTHSYPALDLIVLDDLFIIYRLSAQEEIPAHILTIITRSTGSEELVSVTRTSEEISIVCSAAKLANVSPDISRWKCIKLKGPLNFGLTGILNAISTPLKNASISIFAISTWDTDYVLVPESKAEEAVKVLKTDGWKFTNK